MLIRCNGVSVAVTQSLHSALQRLQTPDGSRLMWIDAICINQDDSEERSIQVTLMREIYLRAQAVIVWLGPRRTHTMAAWATMQLICTTYQEVL
ncbi:heterokaryon incompatibility [Rhexocercosporidium sp. MPI-PUGE-AT-0058]|nr:heterokaryon incompatibility [Rhexocercosporidium sp. MPI-PUGE-AT-0058]